MSNATQNTSGGAHNGHWTATVSKAGTYEFNTGGKFVDRDIDIVVPRGEISPRAVVSSATGSATVSVGVGSKDAFEHYPFTGTGSITGSISGTCYAEVDTRGFVVTDETDDTNNSFSGSISGTAGVSGSMPAAHVSIDWSGTASKPTIAAKTSSDNISVGTITATKPSSGYYAAVAGTSPATVGTLGKIFTPGYLGDDSEIILEEPTIATSGEGSTYYLPITSGSVGVAASDPGTTYTENTTAAISSGGYLTMSEGYYPKTKISLATLIGDNIADISTTTASSSMLSGFRAYDVDGNVLLGTIDTKTGTNVSVSGKTVTIPAGYYSSEVSKSIADAGAITITPSGNTGVVTVGSVSGDYYPLTNTISASGSHASAGYVTTASESGSKSIQVGKIAKSTSSATPGSLLVGGSTLTIGAGYYHEARTYTVPTASSQLEHTTIVCENVDPTITTGYTAPTLVTTAPAEPYITLAGHTPSGTTGAIVDSITGCADRYMSVYAGTYTVS